MFPLSQECTFTPVEPENIPIPYALSMAFADLTTTSRESTLLLVLEGMEVQAFSRKRMRADGRVPNESIRFLLCREVIMKTIPLSAITGWNNDAITNKCCPSTIDITCPHCGRMVNLQLKNHQHDQQRETIAASCRCPACGKTTSVWVIAPSDSRGFKPTCVELCMHPNPTTTREPVIEQGHLPEPALERAYYSALRAYNVGLWDACATSCRKTLEGIVHSLNPDGKGALYEQLRSVFESSHLTEPLIQVADSLRRGGNIGAHFDLEREPDQQIAETMIDLLDYFLEYTFVLKEKAEELKKRLDSMGGASA